EADAGWFELARDCEALRFGFDGAGAGDQSEMRAADEDIAGGSGDADDGVLFLSVTTDKFVGFADGNAFDHAGHGFEHAKVDRAVISGDADGGAGSTGDGMSLKA